ncbi:DUF4870 domain-containing protein [Natranaerobius thermophilus]|uniref:DUF4870 domain-containing protein n=1 Tax=Natranaerobius thermophilus (strain ATCC BAA-1301 / DSM 18059 / JW/NM-WN-LF) TaxID=457570 RepID=B2A4I6_NATTJ|nr:DUF4870 domain-containing protein [Natranaerobius thermophilus]ACB85163.1 hypothetical protein Nther_1588 [Natranaerobius thermophilus JW/NM-WN-LF]
MNIQNENNLIAGLIHLTIFLNIIGLFIASIIFVFKKEDSHFIAHHAKQAIGYQVIILLIGAIMGVSLFIFGGIFGGIVGFGSIIPNSLLGLMTPIFFFGIFSTIIAIIIHGYAIFACIAAFQGKWFKYIVIGNIVNRL